MYICLSVSAEVFGGRGCKEDEEYTCKREIQKVSRGGEGVMGRRVLERWLFCPCGRRYGNEEVIIKYIEYHRHGETQTEQPKLF